jgi:hypothetical protein
LTHAKTKLQDLNGTCHVDRLTMTRKPDNVDQISAVSTNKTSDHKFELFCPVLLSWAENWTIKNLDQFSFEILDVSGICILPSLLIRI